MRFAPAALMLALAGCAWHIPPPLTAPQPGNFIFALTGDTPYSETEAAALDAMIDEMNSDNLAFVLHVGDITAGQGPCTDAWFKARKRQFDMSEHPFIIVPGDNDWVDCHRTGFDPMERLRKFRELFESGDTSLGDRRIWLERQSDRDPRFRDYREHMRWTAANVLFVGVNVQGSNNNLGRTAAMDAEVRARMAAVFAWLDDSLQLARQEGLAGMVIFTQADPDFEGTTRRPGRPDGFAEFRDKLRALALAFAKPVLFVHGDTHNYRLDRPIADPATGEPMRNFTRVCVFGSPLTRWVLAGIDPASPDLFRVSPVPQRVK
jgi:predicted phosphodiesterase